MLKPYRRRYTVDVVRSNLNTYCGLPSPARAVEYFRDACGGRTVRQVTLYVDGKARARWIRRSAAELGYRAYEASRRAVETAPGLVAPAIKPLAPLAGQSALFDVDGPRVAEVAEPAAPAQSLLFGLLFVVGFASQIAGCFVSHL